MKNPLLIKDLFVIRNENVLWKDAVFTRKEAEEEIYIAEKETGEKHIKEELDEYFSYLTLAWY